MSKKIETNFHYNEEVRRCKAIDGIMGKNLIQKLVKDVLENILEAEMKDYLSRNKYERQRHIDHENCNYRNGYSQKNLKSSFGGVDLDILRDRKGEFEPKIVKKYEIVCNKLDTRIYPIIYLDSMYFKVRSNGKIVNKAVYICLG